MLNSRYVRPGGCPPLEVDFCVEAWKRPKGATDFNTDQGSQFTATFTSMLPQGVQVSMDGRGRCMDNVFVERLWRSIKYEEVYLKAYQNGTEASGLLQPRAAPSSPGLSVGSGVPNEPTSGTSTALPSDAYETPQR